MSNQTTMTTAPAGQNCGTSPDPGTFLSGFAIGAGIAPRDAETAWTQFADSTEINPLDQIRIEQSGFERGVSEGDLYRSIWGRPGRPQPTQAATRLVEAVRKARETARLAQMDLGVAAQLAPEESSAIGILLADLIKPSCRIVERLDLLASIMEGGK